LLELLNVDLQRWVWVEEDARCLLARVMLSSACWVHKSWLCVL